MKFSNKIFRCLCLLALLQCNYVLGQGIDTSKFEKEIVAFENADKQLPASKNNIVFTGSSSIRKWDDLSSYFPNKKILNRGFGGSQTDEVIYYADRVLTPYQPKQVVIYVGDNDLASGKTPDKVFSDLKVLFQKIRSLSPKATITFISIKPSPSRWNLVDQVKQVNSMVKNYLSKMKNADYVDIFNPMLANGNRPDPQHFVSDSLHMTPAGYKVWGNVLKRYIK